MFVAIELIDKTVVFVVCLTFALQGESQLIVL